MFASNEERSALLDRLRRNLFRKKTPTRLEAMATNIGLDWQMFTHEDRRTFAGCVARIGWGKPAPGSWRWLPPLSETVTA